MLARSVEAAIAGFLDSRRSQRTVLGQARLDQVQAVADAFARMHGIGSTLAEFQTVPTATATGAAFAP